MKFKLKALGVTLVLLAFSAVGASSALAVEGSITPGAFPATITASSIGTVTLVIGSTGARTIHCSVQGDSTSETSAVSSQVTLGIVFSSCTTTPTGSATVSSTGCDFAFTATNKINATSGEGSGKLEGTSCDLSIVANSSPPPGSRVCEYTVPNQAAVGNILWSSKASDVTLNLNSIQVSVNVLFGTAAACGNSAGGVTIGKLKGELTLFADSKGFGTSLIIS